MFYFFWAGSIGPKRRVTFFKKTVSLVPNY
jgi:hypothetical protein